MRITTDHDAHFAQMSCETCLLETRVSTFSPVFERIVAVFSTMHASCDSTGRPDLEAAVTEYLEHRAEMPTDGDKFGLLFPNAHDAERARRLSRA